MVGRPVEEVSMILTVESYFIVKLFSRTTIAANPTEKIDSFKNGSLTKLVWLFDLVGSTRYIPITQSYR